MTAALTAHGIISYTWDEPWGLPDIGISVEVRERNPNASVGYFSSLEASGSADGYITHLPIPDHQLDLYAIVRPLSNTNPVYNGREVYSIFGILLFP